MDSIDNDDLELLAALIDGKLSGAERARAIKLLADSDEALEAFASAARDEQLASPARPPAIPPIRPVIPIWRRWKVAVPVAAAAAITLAVLPRLVGGWSDAAFATEFASDLASQPRGSGGTRVAYLKTGWESRWPENRGSVRGAREASRIGSRADSLSEFRLAVQTLDLMVALRHGDTAAARSVVDDITQTLAGVDFSEQVAAAYAGLRSALGTAPTAELLDRASSAEGRLRSLIHSSSFERDQWIGAVDLAAQANDTSFFQSKRGIQLIRSAMKAGGFDRDEMDALQQVDSLLSQGTGDSTLNTVHTHLQKIIQRRGS
jgi:hypothetical protein